MLRGSSHADPRERTHLAWMREPSPARASSMRGVPALGTMPTDFAFLYWPAMAVPMYPTCPIGTSSGALSSCPGHVRARSGHVGTLGGHSSVSSSPTRK